MRCQTGQCVPTDQTAPVRPRHPPKRPLSGWAVAALCTIGALASLCIWVICGVYKQRRPATGAGRDVGESAGRSLSPRRSVRSFGSLTPLDEALDAAAAATSGSGAGGVTVCFVGVGYNVETAAASDLDAVLPSASPRGTRRVLYGATGLVKPGEMCAVMGPSGAGKSSLLDILAGQNKSGSVDGQTHLLLPDGGSITEGVARRHACRYVMQVRSLHFGSDFRSHCLLTTLVFHSSRASFARTLCSSILLLIFCAG